MIKKVGILGGAFNPPHKGHLLLAEYAFKELSLDSLLFIPTQTPPHKKLEGNWSFDIRSLFIKTAAYCISQDELKAALQKLGINPDVIQNFVGKYLLEYNQFHRPEFSVSDIEKERPGKSFTIDTVKTLLAENPDWKIHIIIGMDQAEVFNEWKNWQELSEKTIICTAGRDKISFEAVHAKYPFIRFFNFPETDISSTQIRNEIGKGIFTPAFLPDIVKELIQIIG